MQFVAAHRHGLTQSFNDLLRDHPGIGRQARGFKNDDKFIATNAGDDVGFPDDTSDAPCHFAEQQIANMVAQGVVVRARDEQRG